MGNVVAATPTTTRHASFCPADHGGLAPGRTSPMTLRAGRMATSE
ncbi:MAG: hypothetical protein WB239_07230 [Acidimicrobiia bacterium]